MGTTCGVAPATPHILAWPKNRMPIYFLYTIIRRHSSHNSAPRVVISRIRDPKPTASWIAASSSFVLVILIVWRFHYHLAETTISSTILCSVYFLSICNQCNLHQVKCIIYICVSTIWLLWHQHQCLSLPEKGMMNNIIQYCNLFQIVTSARRKIITRLSVSCYMLNWASTIKESVIKITSVIKCFLDQVSSKFICL